ncbi:hypothetical protein [Spirochaeta isovalerica]|uniref:Outer membrane protein beta-barrel domain-containing protein n=1 Tax=Spirochaeta isovalerica TaxID=150 RepID=A0A841R7G4_9SPIO|nr:hypothetical protein [Spirochaeta isovalerica]MBB6479321.1 hypothetical protein [Spirochaeta isovalerica]
MKNIILIISAVFLSAALHAGETGSFFDNLELSVTADALIYNDSAGYGATLGIMTDLGGKTFMKNFMVGLGARYKGAVKADEDFMLNSIGGYGMIGYGFQLPIGLRIMPAAKVGFLYKISELNKEIYSGVDLTVFPSLQIDYLFKNLRIGIEGGYLMTFTDTFRNDPAIENLSRNLQASLFVSYTFRNRFKK